MVSSKPLVEIQNQCYIKALAEVRSKVNPSNFGILTTDGEVIFPCPLDTTINGMFNYYIKGEYLMPLDRFGNPCCDIKITNGGVLTVYLYYCEISSIIVPADPNNFELARMDELNPDERYEEITSRDMYTMSEVSVFCHVLSENLNVLLSEYARVSKMLNLVLAYEAKIEDLKSLIGEVPSFVNAENIEELSLFLDMKEAGIQTQWQYELCLQSLVLKTW